MSLRNSQQASKIMFTFAQFARCTAPSEAVWLKSIFHCKQRFLARLCAGGLGRQWPCEDITRNPLLLVAERMEVKTRPTSRILGGQNLLTFI